jgi:hypothetical protein
MTADALTQVVSMLLAAVAGAVIHRFLPAVVPSPSTPAPSPATPAIPAHDRPLANLLMQLLGMIAAGVVAVPTPASPLPSTSPTLPASGGPAPAVNGSPASLILSVNGRTIVLPIDPSAFAQMIGTPLAGSAPSTG